jgi:hypothetical protein
MCQTLVRFFGAACLIGLVACRDRGPAPARPADPSAIGQRPWRSLVAGGGDRPDSNQLGIEQDLALAVRTFGRAGQLLYAGGPQTEAVQVRRLRRGGDKLRLALGELFDPRVGRDARYQRTTLEPAAAATRDNIIGRLRAAAEVETRGDYLIYLAGHGGPGSTAAEVSFLTWGEDLLTPADLEEVLDTFPRERRVRVVMTSCFSGGFAEILFPEADASRGPTASDRCGLFASTWDQESSGCDPDPDRGLHEGYAVHFLHALKAEDENGKPLAMAALDFDHDGRVSLLEAHTRVRLVLGSIDVPTTTSERWLRAAAPATGPSLPVTLPEEEVVVALLTERLGELTKARLALDTLTDELKVARDAAEDARDVEANTYRAAAAALASRWPALEDPWHPDFDRTLEGHRRAIRAFMDRDPRVREHARAVRDVDTAQRDVDDLQEQRAPLMRLVRAADNLELAGRLRAKGGADWKVFERLRACESSLAPEP